MSKLAALRRIGAVTLVAAALAVPGTAAAEGLRLQADPLRLPPSADGDGAERERLPEIETVMELGAPKVTIHLASYHTRSDAEAGWHVLREEFPQFLADLQPIMRDVDLSGKGRFVRLLAGPVGDARTARDLCAALRGRGAYCAPADLAGTFLTRNWD